MRAEPSRTQIFLARSAVALVMVFAVTGLYLYGFSADIRDRIWGNLLDRPSASMAFRSFLQPAMALIAAAFDGAKDARAGRSTYFLALLLRPQERAELLSEGVITTARIILLGLGMDLIYQYIEFDAFHPGEAATIALLLAFVPYLLLRGIFARVIGWWRHSPLRTRSS